MRCFTSLFVQFFLVRLKVGFREAPLHIVLHQFDKHCLPFAFNATFRYCKIDTLQQLIRDLPTLGSGILLLFLIFNVCADAFTQFRFILQLHAFKKGFIHFRQDFFAHFFNFQGVNTRLARERFNLKVFREVHGDFFPVTGFHADKTFNNRRHTVWMIGPCFFPGIFLRPPHGFVSNHVGNQRFSDFAFVGTLHIVTGFNCFFNRLEFCPLAQDLLDDSIDLLSSGLR